MKTEEEARQTRCGGPEGCGEPKLVMVPYYEHEVLMRFCIASDCMSWRWRRRYADDKRDAQIDHCTGFCGLAGKP